MRYTRKSWYGGGGYQYCPRAPPCQPPRTYNYQHCEPTYNAYFIPSPAYNQLNMRIGVNWSEWHVSVFALNALAQFTFYGAAFTLQPLTIGIAATYH